MEIKKLNRPLGKMTDYDSALWNQLERFSYDIELYFKLNRVNTRVSSQPSVSASGGISLTSFYIRCESDGGEVNITANPQIEAGIDVYDGKILIIEGTSDTNTLIFENGDGLLMGSSFTLGDGDIIAFSWNKDKSKWVMLYSDTK